MTTNTLTSPSFINYLLNGFSGNGQTQARQNSRIQQDGLMSFGTGQSDIWGFNPGNDSGHKSATGWQGLNSTGSGNLALNTGYKTSFWGGSARTQTEQSILNTPKAKAASQWIVNDLKPSENGKAIADVTQVLDVANEDGSTTQIGKNRQVAFQGKPVVQTPSNASWSSSSYKLNYNSDTGSRLTYNDQDSSGNQTDLDNKVYREGDTWVNDTSGKRVRQNDLSTLDGLGAYSAKEATTMNDTGLSGWLGQQWQHVNNWFKGQ